MRWRDLNSFTVREVLDAELFEASCVVFPAYTGTSKVRFARAG